MALVFLDTAQISLLERARQQDIAGYSSFLGIWKKRQCALVFTVMMAHELRRYPNASGRSERYEVLADLAPIRTDTPLPGHEAAGPRTLLEREIVRAMLSRGVISIVGPDADHVREQWTDVLPGRLNADEAGVLRVFEDESFVNFFDRMHDAAYFAAVAGKQAGRTTKKLRVRDLPAEPFTAEDIDLCRQKMAGAVDLLQELSREGTLPAIPEGALPIISGMPAELLTRMAELGPQNALLKQLPVDGLTDNELRALTPDELAVRYWFQFCIRSLARELLGADETQQSFLVRALEFTDCPGSWLEKRLRRCGQRDAFEPRPSHLHDAQRLAYLPYVDLLFTDRQMVEFVRQVTGDESTPEPIRSIPAPVRNPRSLRALEETIAAITLGTAAPPG